MSDPAERLGSIALVTGLVLAGVTGGLLGTAGTVAAAGTDGGDRSCVGPSGGAVYVADSGLTVLENDPDVTYGSFDTAGNAVTFDELTLSATGTARVRVDDAGGAGGQTCLAAVTASESPLTVDPEGAEPVVLGSNLSVFTYRDPVYDPGDGDADLTVEATEPVSATVESTGLAAGTTVVAVAADGGAVHDTARVGGDGTVAFSLPAGTHRVDLRTQSGDTDGGPVDTGDSDGSDDGGDADTDPTVTVQRATLSSTTVATNESVVANVTLATDGDRRVDYAVALRVNGETVRTRTVRVPADSTRTLALTYTFASPGEYSLAVGSRSVGAVTVAPRQTETPGRAESGTATDDPTAAPSGGVTEGDGPGFGVVAAVLAALAAALLARRRA